MNYVPVRLWNGRYDSNSDKAMDRNLENTSAFAGCFVISEISLASSPVEFKSHSAKLLWKEPKGKATNHFTETSHEAP